MANRDPEVGESSVEVRLAKLETDMEWVKRSLERIESRLWWLFGLIVVSIVIPILLRLFFG